MSLACGIHCSPIFYFFFRSTHLYCEEHVCVCVCVCIYIYVCVYVYVCMYVYIYIYISDCVQTVYELQLLPNNAAVKHFYTNLERLEVLTGYLSLGHRRGGVVVDGLIPLQSAR